MPFTPPPASLPHLGAIDFNTATNFAPAAKARYDEFDHKPNNHDPSKCKALLKFPDHDGIRGPVFWSAKMSICADGPAAGPGHLDGATMDPGPGQNKTSLKIDGGKSLPAETIPYVVLPLNPPRTAPFDPLLAVGDMAVVIFKNKITPAVCGDLGPPQKIGEASIRVHEVLQQAGCPDPCVQRTPQGFCRRTRNSSVDSDVLVFVFPGSAFSPDELTLDNINAKVAERAMQLFDDFRGAD